MGICLIIAVKNRLWETFLAPNLIERRQWGSGRAWGQRPQTEGSLQPWHTSITHGADCKSSPAAVIWGQIFCAGTSFVWVCLRPELPAHCLCGNVTRGSVCSSEMCLQKPSKTTLRSRNLLLRAKFTWSLIRICILLLFFGFTGDLLLLLVIVFLMWRRKDETYMISHLC